MIDFKNADFLKLKPVSNDTYAAMITPMFVSGETIIGSFQTIRDGVVFTNKRIITINIQGITGKKRTLLLCLTKEFKPIPWRLPACLTLTAS